MGSPGKAFDAILPHGSPTLTAVEVVAYNVELKDDDGLIGGRATKVSLRAIVDSWRQTLRQVDRDPMGTVASEKPITKRPGELIAHGDPEAAGLMQGAIEQFAQELALVIRAVPYSQGLERHRATGNRRGLFPQSPRRAGDRPSVCYSKGRRNKAPDCGHPQRTRRSRHAGGRASCAGMDLSSARRHPCGGHRRHQHSRWNYHAQS
jgi:hypothetical protein